MISVECQPQRGSQPALVESHLMSIPRSLLPFVILLAVLPLSAQKPGRSMTGSAAKGAASTGMKVAPDLAQRLSKWQTVHMPFHSAGLSPREVKMVYKLVDACRYLEEIFWRQNDSDGLSLYQSLASSTIPSDEKLRHYVWINGSRFDLLDENKPFVGVSPMPPGRGFYPQGLTREQIEQFVKEHPEKKQQIYSATTVVRWHGEELEGLPYHIAYRSFLEPAAKDLREAAALSPDPEFAKFLRLRAEALLTDDFTPTRTPTGPWPRGPPWPASSTPSPAANSNSPRRTAPPTARCTAPAPTASANM